MDLCVVSGNAHSHADFTLTEMLIVDLLEYKLHVPTPFPALEMLCRRVDLTGRDLSEIKRHAAWFIDLASFELLAFEFSAATIAGACLFCALWNMKAERADDDASPRLEQIIKACGGDTDAATLRECINRLVDAFHTLQADRARVAKEKREKKEKKAWREAEAAGSILPA